MSLIRIEHLYFTYDGGSEPVFEDLDLQLDTDWKLGLVGRNGRGKTTLLRLLEGGLEHRGQIRTGLACRRFPCAVRETEVPVSQVLRDISPEAEEWQLVRDLSLLGLDHLIPHLHAKSNQAEGPKSQLKKTTMMVLAVTLHNIPEGMAVGVVYAGVLSGSAQITATGALALSIGIAIQNFPEGAIISLPLRAEGESKERAFLGGVLSGIVEPIGAVLTILCERLVVPALPYLLSFAAGAMLYVVVEALIPEMSQGKHSNLGTLAFAVGFSIMMALDVALG